HAPPDTSHSPLPHSSSTAHPRHVRLAASHTGADASVQSAPSMQPTHAPVASSQIDASASRAQSSDDLHEPHAWLSSPHTGASAGHSGDSRHSAQRPFTHTPRPGSVHSSSPPHGVPGLGMHVRPCSPYSPKLSQNGRDGSAHSRISIPSHAAAIVQQYSLRSSPHPAAAASPMTRPTTHLRPAAPRGARAAPRPPAAP